MLEQLLAGLTLAVCMALLLHMAIGPARRARLHAWWWARWRRLGLKRLGHRRGPLPSPQRQAAARREADAVIERARRAAERGQNGESGEDGDWDGNVYRPKSFDRRPGKRPPPH
jgi:hypothetical protein